MNFLYATADQVNRPDHGGGSVTFNESEALRSLGPCRVWDRDKLKSMCGEEPWGWDKSLELQEIGFSHEYPDMPALAHFYSGTFSGSIKRLKARDVKITYTCAAHSVDESRAEHGRMGQPYPYTHLTDPDLWKRYLEGYLLADKLIVPSTHSRDVMVTQGADPAKIVVIPHGVTLPAEVKPLPSRFTVGYLGACGAPDKGLVYLLQAWKKLNYPDALLRIAGHDSTSDYVRWLVRTHGGGNVEMVGWVPNVSDFYGSLSLYVQPSVSEGFGMEVLEAMAHGRPVTCSSGAGAWDVADMSRFPARDVDKLAAEIDGWKRDPGFTEHWGEQNREMAAGYSWDKIREKYVAVWKELLS